MVGGGPVGARKAASLVECGARVTIVAPETCALVDDLDVAVERRPYLAGEAGAYRLVVSATGIPEVDHRVYLDAEGAGVLMNAADDPRSCSFLMPATLRRGDVSIAVSTAGVSPWLAGWVRRRIAEVVEEEVAELAVVIGEARTAVRSAGVSSEGLDWDCLVDEILWPLVRAGDVESARASAAGWVASVLAGGAGGAPAPGGPAEGGAGGGPAPHGPAEGGGQG